MSANPGIEQQAINTIRTLSIDAVQAANSGHPGTAMALAPVTYQLWQNVLRFDPEDPIWPNRDRFVLSIGHASMLLYSMLHLTNVKAVNSKYERLGHASVGLDDIRGFRQLDSRCPGHPEYRWTSGVETTTGPLGQGVATSVGMAAGGRWMGAYFNRPDFEMFDYDVYAVCGDGCMMEGVASEAASLAGHLKLPNLCWIYDNNKITIEGHTEWAFSEDVATRFIAYGWNVTRVGDANDLDMLDRAFRTFRATVDRPTLIIVDSHIAYGSPNKQDTSAAHGEPLGEEEIRLTKRNYGWPEDQHFLVPPEVLAHFREGIARRGSELRGAWMERFKDYEREFPELAENLYRMQHRGLPEGWDRELPTFPADAEGMGGRIASGKALGRPGAVHEDAPRGEGRRRLRPRRPVGPQLALRHPGARHGLGAERPVAGQAAALRLGIPDLQRLRAPRDPIERADGDSDHPRLHPRFHRRGRRRSDPPAHRAARLAAGGARADHAATRRCQRDRGGLAPDRPAQARARGARGLAPERADPRPVALRAGRGPDARSLCARRRRGG
jgi:transketolase